ncbi:MAG: hypothetical protein H7Z40_05720, partial [Phycisphaerae bacterium]|nr:hypothetical protein [Gemmatimonadaceae bacterium]
MSVSCVRRPLLLALIVTSGVSVPVLAQTPPATTMPVPTVTPEISPALPGDSSAIRAL